MNISAVVVTRGDTDLAPILDRIPAGWETVVWDNSRRDQDLSVFGRYAAISDTRSQVVYVQDDDALVDAEQVAALYEPGRLVANMPRERWADYPDSALVGWGAVFDRDLPAAAFATYLRWHPADEQFHRACDVVFSSLTPRTVHDLGLEHLDHAYADDRMWRQPGHSRERRRVLARCRKLRGGDDDRR